MSWRIFRIPRAVTWNLFGKLFWQLWVAQILILLISLTVARAPAELIFTAVICFGLISLLLSARVVVPLARLIRKARSTTSASDALILSSLDEAEVDAEMGAPQPVEIGEIESALDRMRASLQRRRAELAREREELSTVMGAISDAVLAVDREGNSLFYNSRFESLFTANDLPEKRQRLGEIFRAPEILEAYQNSLRKGASCRIEASLHVLGDQAAHDYSLSVAPLRRVNGEVYGAVGVFSEVTELRRAERIRIEFVANVSHELRTPLTAIKGYADTLREDVARGDIHSAMKFVDALSRNVDRLMALISDLLNLSSIESSSGELSNFSKSGVATREVTERALMQIESGRAIKNITIQAEYLVDSVNADSRRLEQVLVNLLENAVKYIPPGGRVELRWQATQDGVFLHVHDNGPGILAEHLPRLFERFYRVERARSRDAGGTGLGLAIVKHIMQRHGGGVWVTSEVGKGTEFVCQFPA